MQRKLIPAAAFLQLCCPQDMPTNHILDLALTPSHMMLASINHNTSGNDDGGVADCNNDDCGGGSGAGGSGAVDTITTDATSGGGAAVGVATSRAVDMDSSATSVLEGEFKLN